MDSKLVESELKMPVVNLGLHAGLGLEFILNEISSQMKSGDEVVISLEYYLVGLKLNNMQNLSIL